MQWILAKTFEWRKKRFIERREKIYKDLSKDEKKFNLETTIDKIKEYNLLKNKENILKLKKEKW